MVRLDVTGTDNVMLYETRRTIPSHETITHDQEGSLDAMKDRRRLVIYHTNNASKDTLVHCNLDLQTCLLAMSHS